MTPKEKANELISSFMLPEDSFGHNIKPAKQHATTCIGFILQPRGQDDWGANERQVQYWYEVQEEINKM